MAIESRELNPAPPPPNLEDPEVVRSLFFGEKPSVIMRDTSITDYSAKPINNQARIIASSGEVWPISDSVAREVVKVRDQIRAEIRTKTH